MDTSLFRWINGLSTSSPWAHGVATTYADLGIAGFAVLLAIGYLGARHRRDLLGIARSVWAGGAVFVALGIGQIVGAIVDRPRPYAALADVHVLIDRTTDSSLPSDHATVVAAVAAGLWLVDRRLGVVATIGAVLMAFTRVYVGAHYPLDVAAGLGLGAIVAIGGDRVVVPPLHRAAARVAGGRAGWLVRRTTTTGSTPRPA